MKKTVLMSGALLLAGVMFAADFSADFQSAKGLMKQKKYGEAAAAFQKTAQAAPNADLKDQCFSHAAEMYLAAKKFEDADKAAAQIADPAAKTVTDMRILAAQKKFADIVKKYASADFSKYPAKYALPAYELRGKAGMNSRQTRKAGCEDLYKAANLVTGNDMKKLTIYGDIMESSYWQKDTENLRKAGKMVAADTKHPRWGTWMTANCYLAEDALKDGRVQDAYNYASALKSQKSGLYFTWAAYLKGQALVKMGKTDEAKKLWQATLADPQNKCRYTSKIEAALKAL